MSLVFVYADARELDKARLERELEQELGIGEVELLLTGSGKVRSALEVGRYLTASFRSGKRPTVVNVGTCFTSIPDLVGRIVRPHTVVDRDVDESSLLEARISPPAPVFLSNSGSQNLVLGSGDRSVEDTMVADRLRNDGVALLDVDSYAVAWSVQRCLAGPVSSVQFVSSVVKPGALRKWKTTLPNARENLTDAVVQIAKTGSYEL